MNKDKFNKLELQTIYECLLNRLDILERYYPSSNDNNTHNDLITLIKKIDAANCLIEKEKDSEEDNNTRKLRESMEQNGEFKSVKK